MANAILDGNVTDQNAAFVPGALVYVYDYTGGLADLADNLGQILTNPVIADEDGYWSCYVPSGNFYTMKYYWGGRLRYIEAERPIGPEALAGGVILGARDAALDAQVEAESAANRADADAVATAADRVAVAADKVATGLLRDDSIAAALGNGYYPGARSYVPRGLTQASVGAITAGSGGTNGTFDLAWSSGNFAVNPTGTFTVAGGVLTAVTITGPGLYIGASPTVPTPSFAASSGLTSAAVTLTAQYRVTAGQYYLTDHATDAKQVALFQNQANAAVEVDASVDWLNIAAAAASATAAAASATDLASIVSAIGTVGDSGQVLVFEDTNGMIVGEVSSAGGWNIPLLNLVTAGGLAVNETLSVGVGPSLVILDANNYVLWRSDDASGTLALSTELTAARGDRTDLNTRLSQALDPYGNPLTEFNKNRMRRFYYKRRKRLLSQSTQLVIGAMGDSYTHNRNRWSGDTATTLIAKYGDAGGGWTGFGYIDGGAGPPYTHGSTQPTLANGNVRSTYSMSLGGAWTSAYGTVPSPDICCAISSTATNSIRAGFPATPVLSSVDLFWIGTADGVMRYSWDNATWTTINVQGTVGACSYAALTGFPSGAGTLYLEVVSGTCKPAGVNFKSAADGVVFHKLAATGRKMQDLAGQAAVTSWQTAVGHLALDTAIVMHGTNDETAGRSASQFATDGETVVTGLRAAVVGLDVLLAMPAENQLGNTVKMKDLKAALAEKAAALGTAFLDHQRSFGDPDNPTEYGSSGATPLYNVDNTHPEIGTGGCLLTDNFLRFLEVA